MSEAQTQTPVAEKAAADEAQGRLRAFSVGIGQLCQDAVITPEKLAEKAGVAPEALAPALVDAMAEAAEKEAQQKGEQK